MRRLREDRLRMELDGLEADYRVRLAAALTRCAAGQWGLFGHNEHLHECGRLTTDSGAPELLECGEQIDALRDLLGLGPFELHARFRAQRGRQSPNAPGEPKQAQAWLDELSAKTTANQPRT